MRQSSPGSWKAVWWLDTKKGLCFAVTQLHQFPHWQQSLYKDTDKGSLCQSLTKALVLNVLPGPDLPCANDPPVLPASVRPMSTWGLGMFAQICVAGGGSAVQFASLSKFPRRTSLWWWQQLPHLWIPALFTACLAGAHKTGRFPWGHCTVPQASAGVGYPCFACLKFCWTENCGKFWLVAF